MGYKIPKLTEKLCPVSDGKPDWRLKLRKQFSQIFATRCIYCRNFHRPDSYCFQIRFLNRMAGGKRKYESSSDSSDSAEDGELSGSDSKDDGSDKDSEEGVSDEEADHLTDFFSKVERIDQKSITLSLSKRSERLYFSTVLGRGKFDRDGREKIRDKYYLAPKQFAKFNPPDLLDTKLHIVESMDFSGLSHKLQGLHGRLRDVVKVELKHFEALAVSDAAIKKYDPVEVFDGDEATDDWALADLSSYLTAPDIVDDSIQDLEFNRDNFDRVRAELEAYKRKDSDCVKLYRKALNKLEEADKVAREGQLLQKLSSELVWDQLQLTGQADVFLSEARESRYEEFLMPVFKDEVKSRSKNPETRKEKYESNSLFDSKAK